VVRPPRQAVAYGGEDGGQFDGDSGGGRRPWQRGRRKRERERETTTIKIEGADFLQFVDPIFFMLKP